MVLRTGLQWKRILHFVFLVTDVLDRFPVKKSENLPFLSLIFIRKYRSPTFLKIDVKRVDIQQHLIENILPLNAKKSM